jgi:hypothetical protein
MGKASNSSTCKRQQRAGQRQLAGPCFLHHDLFDVKELEHAVRLRVQWPDRPPYHPRRRADRCRPEESRKKVSPVSGSCCPWTSTGPASKRIGRARKRPLLRNSIRRAGAAGASPSPEESMSDSQRNVPRTPQPNLAEARARLVKLLGRMLAEEWLARQRPRASPAPQPRQGD